MGKLKSITNRIHWSLLLKPAILGVGWVAAPFWAFLILALVLYFTPSFGVPRTLFPFAIVLTFGYILPKSALTAFALAALFYLIIGIKEFLLVDRGRAREFFVIITLFLMSIEFFGIVGREVGQAFSAPLAVGALVVFSILVWFFEGKDRSGEDAGERFNHPRFAAGLVALIVVEMASVVALLPMDAFYKSALVFIIAAMLIEIVFDYIRMRLTRAAVFFYSSVCLIFFLFILMSNVWQP